MKPWTAILIIDDEPQIHRFLKHSLAAAGYHLLHADTAAAGLSTFATHRPDIVVLDLGLPDLDGKTVIGQIRQTSQTPIIVLSARDQETEKIAALDLGADDFVAKPFGIGELLARIRVCLRANRTVTAPSHTFTLGDLIIDEEAHRVGGPGKLSGLRQRNSTSLFYWPAMPARSLHTARFSKVCGVRRMSRIRLTCVSSSGSCARRLKPNQHHQG